ncbi:uncharacterized protein LTR77_009388 [Saxophila tyrrhenica]|uniref:Uncharacterized protein n=1 Tax=Saxophila tyrrhenica TaxID=1690608 RepID=A0AAV9P1T9_9PEZI|nr:hypothetical protein LTR77_009388 [Saxophila tyrrhenica]
MAYDKYQQKQAARAPEASHSSNNTTALFTEKNANAEVLSKAGIPPPSYDDVVVNRAELPEYSHNYAVGDEKKGALELEDSSDEEVVDGRQRYVDQPRSSSSSSNAAPGMSKCQTRCAEKRAARMQRKAEKAAEKAEQARARLGGQRILEWFQN